MTDLPATLGPSTSEVVLKVRKVTPTFKRWCGDPITGDFESKDLIDLNGERLFAELAILRRLEQAGWAGRWVQPYQAAKDPCLLREWGNSGKLGDQTRLPIEDPAASSLLQQIAERNGGYSGCWDVFAWRGDQYLFAEAKRAKNGDSLKPNQKCWLTAADLTCKQSKRQLDFLLVEWNFSE